MASNLVFREGDTLPKLSLTLTLDGQAVNLTGATVKLRYRLRSSTTAIERTMTVDDPLTGKVSYEWQAGELATTGAYLGEVVTTFPDSSQLTIPNVEPFVFIVRKMV